MATVSMESFQNREPTVLVKLHLDYVKLVRITKLNLIGELAITLSEESHA